MQNHQVHVLGVSRLTVRHYIRTRKLEKPAGAKL
jgi:hypothetical protein